MMENMTKTVKKKSRYLHCLEAAGLLINKLNTLEGMGEGA